MTNEPDTIRVFIPLTFKKRNGRPKILPPDNVERLAERRQDPHVLRAIGRAWGWRRRIESGEASTLAEIAKSEKVSEQFVGRNIRLAYLAPGLIEQLVIYRKPLPISVNALCDIALLPWPKQTSAISGSTSKTGSID